MFIAYIYTLIIFISMHMRCFACMVRDGGITLKYIITLALKSAYVYVIDVN